MKSNWNLPPGVTARDVEGPDTVVCPECGGSGNYEKGEEDGACPKCGGQGEITRKESNDQANG